MEGDSASRLVFGPFELRTESGELFRDGVRIRLQPQPARLLELLARRSGEIVSREEIRRQIWGEDTFFDLEQGLNFSIRRIRVALDDSATQPRYLETVPRRGYRFLAPVQAEPASAPAASLPAPPPDSRQDSRRRTVPGFVATLVLGLLLTGSPGERQPAGVDAAMQPERSSRSPGAGGGCPCRPSASTACVRSGNGFCCTGRPWLPGLPCLLSPEREDEQCLSTG
jgi:DNA-binding winged helix-turn-helix (wHTH) protein